MKSIHDQVENLKDVLSQIITTLSEMLELEDQKYETIRDMNFHNLSILNEQEEVLVSKINLLEIQRLDVLENLSAMVGFDPDLPVTAVISKFPEESQTDIRTRCLEIRRICDRISTATERNSYILNSNTEIFNQILDITQGRDGLNDQYTSMGTTHESKNAHFFVLDQIV